MSTVVDELGWLKAMPIGILFFLGTFLGITRKRAGRAKARRDYPALAARLGLGWTPPANPQELGRLRGEFEGYRVAVDPDERARIVVFLDQELGLDIRTYAHWKRAPVGFQALRFQSRALTSWLPGAFVETGHADRLEALSALEASLLELGAHKARMTQFSLAGNRLECLFDFGNPPYVPAGVVERVLPCLAHIAAASRSLPLESARPDTDPPAPRGD